MYSKHVQTIQRSSSGGKLHQTRCRIKWVKMVCTQYTNNTYILCILTQKSCIHYGPGQSLRVPGRCGPQISRQSTHAGSKVVNPMHRPPLPQEIFLVLIACRGCFYPGAILRPEVLCKKKKSVTIGNRTHDLPTCGAVRQSTVTPHTQ